MNADLLALIERDRLCLRCLATKMGRPPGEVALALEDVARVVRVSAQVAICAGCASVRTAYKLA